MKCTDTQTKHVEGTYFASRHFYILPLQGPAKARRSKQLQVYSKWFAPPTITCSTYPRKKLVLALPNFGYYIS
jgi:hypothetical protein